MKPETLKKIREKFRYIEPHIQGWTKNAPRISRYNDCAAMATALGRTIAMFDGGPVISTKDRGWLVVDPGWLLEMDHPTLLEFLAEVDRLMNEEVVP